MHLPLIILFYRSSHLLFLIKTVDIYLLKQKTKQYESKKMA